MCRRNSYYYRYVLISGIYLQLLYLSSGVMLITKMSLNPLLYFNATFRIVHAFFVLPKLCNNEIRNHRYALRNVPEDR